MLCTTQRGFFITLLLVLGLFFHSIVYAENFPKKNDEGMILKYTKTFQGRLSPMGKWKLSGEWQKSYPINLKSDDRVYLIVKKAEESTKFYIKSPRGYENDIDDGYYVDIDRSGQWYIIISDKGLQKYDIKIGVYH